MAPGDHRALKDDVVILTAAERRRRLEQRVFTLSAVGKADLKDGIRSSCRRGRTNIVRLGTLRCGRLGCRRSDRLEGDPALAQNQRVTWPERLPRLQRQTLPVEEGTFVEFRSLTR